jgi:hypothetical protein
MHITLTSSTTADDAAPNKTAKASTTTCSKVIHKAKVKFGSIQKITLRGGRCKSKQNQISIKF